MSQAADSGDAAAPDAPPPGEGAAAEDAEGDEVIVVTGTRTERRLGDAPVATEVIEREEIVRSGARDLGELLGQHPGVDVQRNYLGSIVRMQGLDPEHVMVLVDGQRVTGRTGGAIDLSRYTTERIEQVEIVKGPSSALYGSDAMGGVIHVVTRSGPRKGIEAEGDARLGTNLTGDGAVSVASGGDEVRLRGTATYQHREPYDLDEGDLGTDGDGLDRIDVGGKAIFEVSQDHRLTTNASYARTDRGGIDASETGATFDRRNLTEEALVGATSRWSTSERGTLDTELSASIFRDQYVLDQQGASALDDYDETGEQLLEASTQYNTHRGRHTVSVGVEGVFEALQSDRLEDGSGQRGRLAPYAQDEWRVLTIRPLVLVPGLRADFDTQFGQHFTPKLGARFDPTETLTLRASSGFGYRAPSFREQLLLFSNPTANYQVAGNPDLLPETSRNVSAGVEWRPAEPLWMSVSGYHNELDNLIAVTTVEEGSAAGPTIFSYDNIARARTRGIESQLGVEVVQGAEVQASYTLTDTLDRDQNRPLEGRALHRGTGHLDLQREAWGTGATLRASVVGPQPFYVDIDGDGESDTVQTDPYELVDVRLFQRLTDGLELSAGVENALDAGDATYVPVTPRWFYLGARGALGRRPQPKPTEVL